MDNLILSLTYIIGSTVFAFLISPLIINFLYKYKIVRLIDADFSEIIESRRLKAGTPIMGGIIIVITVTIFTLFSNWEGSTKIPLLVFLLSALLGGLDDFLNIYGRARPVRSIHRTLKLIKVHKSMTHRLFLIITLPWQAYKRLFFLLGSNPGKGIQAHEKILIQILSGVLVAWWIYFRLGWDTVSIPFYGGLELGWLMPLFIVFVVVALSNAVNITDGMDGLSSGLLIYAFIALFVISVTKGDFVLANLIAVIIGSLIAYLYFNIPPARIQMGDIGSLSLGAIFASIAFALDVSVLIPVICLMFVIEIASVLFQGISRRLLGRRILKMAPLHHHFEIVGWNEEKIVMRFWLFGMISAVLGILLSLV